MKSVRAKSFCIERGFGRGLTRYIALVILGLLLSSCSAKLEVPLPNDYTWEGKRFGSSDISSIIDEKSGAKIDNVLDIFVKDNFIYGCFYPKANGVSRYFILDTASRELKVFPEGNAQKYAEELRMKKLPDGFLTNAINILEVRKNLKPVYWNKDTSGK